MSRMVVKVYDVHLVPDFGWWGWDGDQWSRLGDCQGPVSLEPTFFDTELGYTITQCLGDHGIEKHHDLVAPAGVDEDVHPVGTGPYVEGGDDNALDFAVRVPSGRPFQQHVSFPALQLGAGVGRVVGSVHGNFLVQEAAA